MCIRCSQARKSQGIPYQGAKLDKKFEKSDFSPHLLDFLHRNYLLLIINCQTERTKMRNRGE